MNFSILLSYNKIIYVQEDKGKMSVPKISNFVIDSHAHLLNEYYPDIDSVVSGAVNDHVKAFVVPAVDLKTSLEVLELANIHQNIFGAVGIHPHEAKDYDVNTEKKLYELARNNRIVAIGESGLDFYYNLSSQEQQINAFKSQLNIAKDLNKPIIVHCRDAFDLCFDLIEESGWRKGVFHCFTGNVSILPKISELNFHISFSGILTFKTAKEIQQCAKLANLDKILIETDCPYLSPEPMRGKTNEPKFMLYTLAKLSQLRDEDIDDLAQKTFDNTVKLFDLKV